MKVPPAAVINIIRENLNDRYRKGFPILKELVQNADDAEATQLHLGWVKSLGQAQHPLLGGPALFVVNNGAFQAADGEAIDCIGLSSKAGSKFSVGKFGLGLKSIFHVCESFLYIAIDEQTGQTVAHIVNPWADSQGKDEFHQGWAEFSVADRQAVVDYLRPVLDQSRFFCLWIPLRRQDQLQGHAPITKDFPGDTNHPPRFLTDHCDTQLATLLPMLRSLQRVTIWLPDGSNNHRIELLTSLSGQLDLHDRLHRRCLRYLLHGQPQHFEDDKISLLVGDISDGQNMWARITDCVLAMEKTNWRVIERDLANHLTPIQRANLGVQSVNRRGVEALLQAEEQFTEINRRLQFTAEECDTLLRELSSEQSLRRLRIHETVDGHRFVSSRHIIAGG